ncbi:MAG: zinc ribbon domain-containing protein [Clostridia bacterium]|nr:zinc ribbon domain-containing protein [Clostridia bacterium]
MFCTHCGAQLPEDARFCSRCGKEIRRTNIPLDFDRLRTERELGYNPVLYQHILTFLKDFPSNAYCTGLMPRTLQPEQTKKRFLSKTAAVPELTGWHLMHLLRTFDAPNSIRLETTYYDLYACTDGRFCFGSSTFCTAECLARFIATNSHYGGDADRACRSFDWHYQQWLKGAYSDLGISWSSWINLPSFIYQHS